MTEFLTYLFKAAVLHAALGLIYLLLLKRQKTFAFNRSYLVGALLLGLLVPLLQLPSSAPENIHQLHQAYLEPFSESVENIMPVSTLVGTKSADKSGTYWALALCGLMAAASLLLLTRFALHLRQLRLHTLNRNHIKHKDYRLYPTPDGERDVFSFFSHIFIPIQYWKKPEFDTLLTHELAHARRLHSLDRLLLDFIIALFWFNPFIYLYRRELMAIHEYQADEMVLSQFPDKRMYQELIYQFISSGNLRMSSPLGNYFIKNRIKMMNKSKNSKSAKIATYTTMCLSLFVALGFAGSDNGGRSEDFLVIGPFTEPFELFVPDFERLYASPQPSLFPVDQKSEHRISSEFGRRKNPWTGKEQYHNGIDIVAPVGTEVYATADGVVEEAKIYVKAWGHSVIIQHEDESFTTRYAHMERFVVEDGDKVKAGQIIGYVGSTGKSTGPHLHYSVAKDGKFVDPWNYISDYKAEE